MGSLLLIYSLKHQILANFLILRRVAFHTMGIL